MGISGNGGDAAVSAFVDKYGDSATGVTWHFYRTPGLADNAFTPVARNVGPGGILHFGVVVYLY